MAVDSEEVTEKIFAEVLRAGIEAGIFRSPSPELAAGLIQPLLQDWHVKRAEYRRRRVSASDYVAIVSAFVMTALGAAQTEVP